MSTTIHVTIQDDREALAVVATLLNQRYEVSIDLDVVPDMVEPNYMSREEVDIREKLWGEATMAETADQQERQRRHDMRYTEALDAQVVECTACGAMVGDWCRTPKGGRYKTFVHADRIRAFHTFKNQ